MNHSYQYINGGIRGEEATQGQGEDNNIGNRTAPASPVVVLPSFPTHDFIKKSYDSSEDRHAKKNRDNMARELREQGYQVCCGWTTNLRGRSIYHLDADKDIIEPKKEEESINV